jgi:hypothetical protein
VGKLYSFFNLAARWRCLINPRPGRFSLRNDRPGTHCIGDWVSPRASLNGCGKPDEEHWNHKLLDAEPSHIAQLEYQREGRKKRVDGQGAETALQTLYIASTECINSDVFTTALYVCSGTHVPTYRLNLVSNIFRNSSIVKMK